MVKFFPSIFSCACFPLIPMRGASLWPTEAAQPTSIRGFCWLSDWARRWRGYRPPSLKTTREGCVASTTMEGHQQRWLTTSFIPSLNHGGGIKTLTRWNLRCGSTPFTILSLCSFLPCATAIRQMSRDAIGVLVCFSFYHSRPSPLFPCWLRVSLVILNNEESPLCTMFFWREVN